MSFLIVVLAVGQYPIASQLILSAESELFYITSVLRARNDSVFVSVDRPFAPLRRLLRSSPDDVEGAAAHWQLVGARHYPIAIRGKHGGPLMGWLIRTGLQAVPFTTRRLWLQPGLILVFSTAQSRGSTCLQ